MTRVAVLQSSYLPWKGYFDLIADVDHVVIYDTAQFTKNDWRNRNRIKTQHGLHWLTVPVVTHGRPGQTINETVINGRRWARKHLTTMQQSYARAPYFKQVFAVLEPILVADIDLLSELNVQLMRGVADLLGVTTPFSRAENYLHQGNASEKVLDLCRAVDADTYVSGPSAQAYLDTSIFARSEVRVEWFDYAGYPEYPQLWGKFEHAVSVLDLLFNTGPHACRYMKCADRRRAPR